MIDGKLLQSDDDTPENSGDSNVEDTFLLEDGLEWGEEVLGIAIEIEKVETGDDYDDAN